MPVSRQERMGVERVGRGSVTLTMDQICVFFRKIMHKHGDELHYIMHRGGHFCLCTMRKHAYTYITYSKMV